MVLFRTKRHNRRVATNFTVDYQYDTLHDIIAVVIPLITQKLRDALSAFRTISHCQFVYIDIESAAERKYRRKQTEPRHQFSAFNTYIYLTAMVAGTLPSKNNNKICFARVANVGYDAARSNAELLLNSSATVSLTNTRA